MWHGDKLLNQGEVLISKQSSGQQAYGATQNESSAQLKHRKIIV